MTPAASGAAAVPLLRLLADENFPGPSVRALRAAAEVHDDGWRLTGCTLAVTLEPCTMCAGAAVLARVDRIVFGAWEPKTGAVGSLWDVVRDRRLTHRPEVLAGVRERECSDLLREWFRGGSGSDGALP